MKSAEQINPRLLDLWTTSDEYRRIYQTQDEVETIVRLMEMPGAAALVDIGCGNGAFAIACARANAACRVWAFDALESAVTECRARAGDLIRAGRFTAGVAWGERIPLADASVDRVLCRSVLHHLADADALYREIARLLRPGGLLLLQAPCNYWPKRWGRVIGELYRVFDDSHPRQYHQPADVIAGLNVAGLAMQSAACWPYPWEDLKPAEVEFIKRHGAEARFQLSRGEDGKWNCSLYWVRVLARRM